VFPGGETLVPGGCEMDVVSRRGKLVPREAPGGVSWSPGRCEVFPGGETLVPGGCEMVTGGE